MIKKLRKKFILITMCSVIAVLTLIIGSINIAVYKNIDAETDILLNIIAENGGTFPRNNDRMGFGPAGSMKNYDLSPEAPFNTRYFTATVNENGDAVTVDTGRIAAVTTNDAQIFAETLAENGKTEGYHKGYKFCTVSANSYIQYIFLDCSSQMNSFYSFLLSSIVVSFFGILLVFLLVFFLSKIAVKPVAESYEKQKRFITDAGHEIKTPLTIIDAGADVLEMENGENEWTQSIKNQVKRLTHLTEKLIFLSKMEEDSTRLQISDFSLSQAAQETVDSFEAIALTKGKTLHTDIQQNIIYKGDESMIKQLFSLLLDNAMKYSDDKGIISFILRASGKNKEIRIRNTVTQIERGRHDEFFERFRRRDESRNSKTGGHGIGLSVAKAIVNAHKGKITAFSENENTIDFVVIL